MNTNGPSFGIAYLCDLGNAAFHSHFPTQRTPSPQRGAEIDKVSGPLCHETRRRHWLRRLALLLIPWNRLDEDP
jgi:hypothetical protein